MQRVAFRLRVKPERQAEYEEIHARVWPELLADMRAAGIRNYTIFADGSDLFAYLECDDWDAVNRALASSDADRRWQSWMNDYLDRPLDENGAPLAPALLREVFRMD